MKRLVVAFVLVLAPVALAKGRATRSTRVVVPQWTVPQCEVSGLASIRYVEPDGTTHGTAYNFQQPATVRIAGLGVGAPANTLWAFDDRGTIHRSGDAGCTWIEVASVPELLAKEAYAEFAARHADRVYVYTTARPVARATSIVRITGATIETFRAPDSGGFNVVEVSPTDSLHLRAIGRTGVAWESKDGAATWTAVGSPSLFIHYVRSASFNPRNFDHILVGTRVQGLWESLDGGRTWALKAFATKEVEGVRFAPSNPDVIYAAVVPALLQRSTDGGRTFEDVGVPPNGPFAFSRVYYTDRVFAVSPREPLAFTAEGERAVGVRMVAPAGTVTSKAVENIGDTVWAPNGIVYYATTWAELR